MRKQIAVWLRACADQLDPPKQPDRWVVRTGTNAQVTWKETA